VQSERELVRFAALSLPRLINWRVVFCAMYRHYPAWYVDTATSRGSIFTLAKSNKVGTDRLVRSPFNRYF